MSQLLWLAIVAGQAAIAAVWWWMVPGSSLALVAMSAVCVAALAMPKRVFPAIVPGILLFWMALAISARVTFPRSIGFSWNVTFLSGCALFALWWKQLRPRVESMWLVPVLALPALILGVLLPSTQRAPEPSTHPIGGTIADAPAGKSSGIVKLDKQTQVHPDSGRVVLRRDALLLTVDALLSFKDRSPDATWVSLAPELATPTVRKLLASQAGKGHVLLAYEDEDKSSLEVTAHPDAIELDARSRLAQPVYSHLNEWTILSLRGSKKPALSFSPAPEHLIDIPLIDAPRRFAYVDTANVFHVAEAQEHDKGPFHELAHGKLDGPLTITLYDDGKPVYRLVVEDWAKQASIAGSPTASDGIPVNDIELAHVSNAPDSPIFVVLSLAATSIGRGWQSVGHAAGTYRNRMTITMP